MFLESSVNHFDFSAGVGKWTTRVRFGDLIAKVASPLSSTQTKLNLIFVPDFKTSFVLFTSDYFVFVLIQRNSPFFFARKK